MNPLTNVKNITKLNEREIQLGISGQKSSWHNQYKDSAWLFIGGLPFDLTEGDVICVFSQYGEIVNINLVRDKKTGKSKGFCFLCYENQQSTVLAVDNFNAIKILGRTIRVDHVANYKPPKEYEDDEEELKALRNQGCAPTLPTEKPPVKMEDNLTPPKPKTDKKTKKYKKKSKSKKHSKHVSSESSDSEESLEQRVKKKKHKSNREENRQAENMKVKVEKYDPGYEKYAIRNASLRHSPRSDSGDERTLNRKSSVGLSTRYREFREPNRESPNRDRDSRQKHNRDSFMRDRSPISNHDSRQKHNRDLSVRDSRRKYDSTVRETSPSRESRVAKYKYSQDSPALDRSNSKRYDPRRNI